MKTQKLFTFLLLITFSFSNFAQKSEKIEFSIKVRDDKNKAVPGALILIDNIKQSRKTNSKGIFKIRLNKTPKEITVFSPLLGIKKVKYTGQKNIFARLGKNNGIDSVVDINPNNKNTGTIQFQDIYDYLRGKVAGVNIGSDNTIRIRGFANFSGGDGPLLVLNGTQVDLTTFGDIEPSTIKKVKVLKGPDAAIYGLRGANGVIEVTTAF
ncbi:TonB-dependent receptor SusC [Polaribacter huanghezhanensis]|uniref:TonB-dependent receptor plug domain-containing protein n=1 Tax=Polaribacter huanghezhanensis TaxID=1354726 RepID=UPI0026481BBA|nr:TonB-dependent receptor plug domain-containing protein [Polaribacter huanghezhanensis]WKD84938.1 TonB-dependent receptor SusC [Polaribacter huanghezhanensis]